LALHVNLDDAVDAREYNHEEKGKQHHLDEGKIKSDGFIHLVNVGSRAAHPHGHFLALVAAGALLFTLFLILSE
jgi:hypothetical protein